MKSSRRQRRDKQVSVRPPATESPQLLLAARGGSRKVWIIAACLAVAAFVAYIPSLNNGFTNWDDDRYVTENPFMEEGLSWGTVTWAFGNFHASNWHPLTWLSHAADVSLFGLERARGHHLVSMALHALNAALLLLVLHRLTRRLWLSAVVAALFALHPLHVESAAWVAERKDVLSALFILLTLWAYAVYVEQRGWWRYSLVVLAFAAALLSKPMAVTVPFVLLLLDYWPLRRLSRSAVLEKAPLLAMAAASCVVTYLAQHAGGATRTGETLTLIERLSHATYAYIMYLGKMVWPAPGTLLTLYPLPEYGGLTIPGWLALFFAAALVLFSVLAWRLRQTKPYLFVGWFIYLGMLVPVIGLMQVGKQVMADRYTYLPLVGVFLVVVWLMDDLLRFRSTMVKVAALAFAAMLCAGLGVLTWKQQALWHDSITLWTPVTQAYPGSATAQNNLGHAWACSGLGMGANFKAISCYRDAVDADPQDCMARTNLATNLAKVGRQGEAEVHYLRVIELSPDYPPARNGYGTLLLEMKRPEEAIVQFRRVLQGVPQHVPAKLNLATALVDAGHMDEAISYCRKLLKEIPDAPQTWSNLGLAWERKGALGEARRCFDEAKRLGAPSRTPEFEMARDDSWPFPPGPQPRRR